MSSDDVWLQEVLHGAMRADRLPTWLMADDGWDSQPIRLAGDHGLLGQSGAHALLGMPLCGFRLGSA